MRLHSLLTLVRAIYRNYHSIPRGDDSMAMKCKCNKVIGAIALIAGILYLLMNVGAFDWTFGIQWYTIALILVGLAMVDPHK